MSIRLKIRDGYYAGFVAAGRQQINYKTIFPDNIEPPEDLTDVYGNLQYQVEVMEDTVLTEEGEHVKKTVKFVKHRQVPTAEQIERRKKQLFKARYSYDRDDEIALIKDAINEMRQGREVPEEYRDMEMERALKKKQVDEEIDADLLKISKEHKSV